MCSLPQEEGPCADYENRWYWNAAAGFCQQFWYGGCDGNKNNFLSEDECQLTCQPDDEKDDGMSSNVDDMYDGYRGEGDRSTGKEDDAHDATAHMGQ